MNGRIESAGNGHTRRRGYTRIEPEAGGARRRIYPNTIRDNRRRDGREGELGAADGNCEGGAPAKRDK